MDAAPSIASRRPSMLWGCPTGAGWKRLPSALVKRALVAVLALAAAAPVALAQDHVGRETGVTPMGRLLQPVGKQVQLGTFPTGQAISPDGRFSWAVDAGRGPAAVHVIDLARAQIVQDLPIPGGYVGVAFAPDGRTAYVSGVRADGKAQPGVKGENGDVIHVFAVDPKTGKATERDPIAISGTQAGQAAQDELPPASSAKAWPEGLAVTPDGKFLVVALGQADQAAIVDLATKKVALADVGRYPFGVAVDPRRPRAYVTSEYDGTVTALDLPSGHVAGTVGVGGPGGDRFAHAEGIAADPARDLVYVAVTNRDLVAAVDTKTLKVEKLVPVRRKEAGGSQPVAVAVAPDARTLYVASANEDALAGIALADRAKKSAAKPKRVVRVHSARYIRRHRRKPQGRTVRACAGPTRAQERRYLRAVLRGGKRPRLKRVVACPPAGELPGLKRWEIIGRAPTAWYPTDVDVSADGRRLVWLTGRGYGAGPNKDGTDISRTYLGRAGVLDRPTDRELRALNARAERQTVPANARPAPPGTPVVGGGPIKHVFYVVKENRTYDQIFGSEKRGDGDPSLVMFDDNGAGGPAGGVTPNAHALARAFPLLDNVFADSEASVEGHKITSGSLA